MTIRARRGMAVTAAVTAAGVGAGLVATTGAASATGRATHPISTSPSPLTCTRGRWVSESLHSNGLTGLGGVRLTIRKGKGRRKPPPVTLGGVQPVSQLYDTEAIDFSHAGRIHDSAAPSDGSYGMSGTARGNLFAGARNELVLAVTHTTQKSIVYINGRVYRKSPTRQDSGLTDLRCGHHGTITGLIPLPAGKKVLDNGPRMTFRRR